MTTSPDFADHRIHQTAWRTATLDNAETNGDGYDKLVDVKKRITERRRQPPPNTPDGYLHELPALILLDRLPTPMLATGLDGVLIYANPAFATMLGHPGTTTLTEQPLPALLADIQRPRRATVSPHCAPPPAPWSSTGSTPRDSRSAPWYPTRCT